MHTIYAVLDEGRVRLECKTEGHQESGLLMDSDCSFNEARKELGTPELAESIEGKGEFPLLIEDVYDSEFGEPTWQFTVVGSDRR